MEIGIFAKTFARPDLEATLDAVAARGIDCIQFNFSVAGLPTLPDEIPDSLIDRVRRAASERRIRIAAVSGTFNMIDPDVQRRRDGLRRLRVLAEASARIGAPVITLCSGSRDPDDMWRWHPGNAARDAWDDLSESMREAVGIARDAGVKVAFEPEAANVIDSARKGRRLLDEVGSPQLGVVVDPANLVESREPSEIGDVIDEAIAVLSGDILLAHAKDVSSGDRAFVPAGQGLLDYGRYLQRLREVGYSGPLILHSLAESDVDGCVSFLRSVLADHPSRIAG